MPGIDDPSRCSVSVIIPVFNDAAGVLACLDGLRMQTYPMDRIEAIIVDNGSNPAIDVTGNYPFTIRLERCATPGSYAARNAGARSARGDVLVFTDADCVPRSNWIEAGVQALEAGGGRQLVGGEVIFDSPPRRTGVALYQLATGFQQKQNIERKGFSATANLFCTREQFQRVGPFDERLVSAGDREWAWRAHGQGLELVHAPDAIVSTKPRTSLAAAIRQARRVTAGRYHLRTYSLAWMGPAGLQPHRSSLGTLLWILRHPDFSWWERIRVLNAAVILKIAAVVEAIRLRFGASAERR